jgi:hypothetical protein
MACAILTRPASEHEQPAGDGFYAGRLTTRPDDQLRLDERDAQTALCERAGAVLAW